MDKQVIRINESQLRQMVNETVKRVLAEGDFNEEDLDEGFFGNMADKFGAIKDTFTKGGNYDAHFNNRQLERSRNDIENLKGKYGVQNGQNGKQWINQNSKDAIAQINAKYDQKIQKLEDERQQEIAKAQSNSQKQWNKYQSKKSSLDQARNQAYQGRRSAMNTDPYAGFKE